MNKIVRTACLFNQSFSQQSLQELSEVASKLESAGFLVQTKRFCSPNIEEIFAIDSREENGDVLLSFGSILFDQALQVREKFFNSKSVFFNVDLSSEEISQKHADFLFSMIKEKPGKTFNFTFTFNNVSSSPFFPSVNFEKEGVVVGLQPTDLSQDCKSLGEWLDRMKTVWNEIDELLGDSDKFLGIDVSVAPLFEGSSSLVNFVKRLGLDFSASVTSDFYMQITKYIKSECPRAVGLCGLMFPCLEDFELANEYEGGNFSIERNVFLSLHSGLGIDTYPIGVDENHQRVRDVLRLVQGLSDKYKKPLSVRFVSDGVAGVGQKTNFENQYLKDVVVRGL